MTRHNDHPPFSIEVKITDDKGKKIFHFKPSGHNLMPGLEQTKKFIVEKLGISEKEKKQDKYVRMLVGDKR